MNRVFCGLPVTPLPRQYETFTGLQVSQGYAMATQGSILFPPTDVKLLEDRNHPPHSHHHHHHRYHVSFLRTAILALFPDVF